MGSVKQSYGPWSREMLASLRAGGRLGLDAFAAFLHERGAKVDRTLVSHWCAGRTHLPADVLPILADFVERPELVFGPYLRPLRWTAVELPKGRAADGDLVDLTLDAAAALGRLQDALREARSPDSPGGIAITDQERDGLRGSLDDLIRRLADLRARLTLQAGQKTPGSNR